MTAAGLYFQCVGWGLSTGAAIGGGTGAIAGLFVGPSSGVGLVPLSLGLGALFGVVIALIPTVVGAGVVTAVIARRHPQPASTEAVHADLVTAFAAVVGVLNVGAFLTFLLSSPVHPDDVAKYIAVLAGYDAGIALMLRWAARRLSRRWGEPDAAGGEVWYGNQWRAATDPAGRYAVLWVPSTQEICAARLGAGTEQVLGWAKDRSTLDAALAGWQARMADPDGLAWVRRQLAAAAEKTAAPA